MRDMFANYDDDIRRNKKIRPIASICDHVDSLYTETDARMIYDAMGRCLGIRAHYTSSTVLYFQVTDMLPDECALDFLQHCEITFALKDTFNAVKYEKKYPMNCFDEWGVLTVEIDPQTANLKKDIYKIELTGVYIPENKEDPDEPDTSPFTLFYQDDATINFI